MILRPYQAEAVEAVYRALRERNDNPCVVIPTAGGKTPVMAQVCKDAVGRWGGRVLILAHVKELLEQAVDKLYKMAPELTMQVGVYSAGLGARDTEHPIIVAGIQSAYRHACDLGRFDLIIIDEAHMIPPDGEGMYRTFLSEAQVVNPDVRLIGLTATPYRMTTGQICGEDNLLQHVCFSIGIRELIVQGHLCPLRSKAGLQKVDTSGLHLRGGEFVASEVEALMDDAALVKSAVGEILEYTRGKRHSTLVFASGVEHGRHVQAEIEAMTGGDCGAVFGDTPALERAAMLERFRAGGLAYLVNCQVLTTGFDAPNIDCIALLRPTNSPGLYYQMVGRGFRIDEGKADCLVLDFGGNIMRHGPVDVLDARERAGGGGGGGEAPAKECPNCHAVIAIGYAICPECGHEFPKPERRKHDAKATTAGVLSGEVTTEERSVSYVEYSVHTKRGADEEAPKTMRVQYYFGLTSASEWICFEHTGFALQKAHAWWQARSNAPVPATAAEAVRMADEGALAETFSVTVRHVAGEKYDSVVGWRLGDKPEWAPREPGEDLDEEDLAAEAAGVVTYAELAAWFNKQPVTGQNGAPLPGGARAIDDDDVPF